MAHAPSRHVSSHTLWRAVIDKNRIAGSIEEVKGAAKEAIGKAVGDAKLQNDGTTRLSARFRMPSMA